MKIQKLTKQQRTRILDNAIELALEAALAGKEALQGLTAAERFDLVYSRMLRACKRLSPGSEGMLVDYKKELRTFYAPRAER